MATVGEAAQNSTMIEVDLCCMPPKALHTNLAPSHVSASATHPTNTKTINLCIEGAFKQVQWTSPATSMPVSQHSTSRGKLPSVTLGAPHPTKVEDSLRLEGPDSAAPELIAISSQVLQCVTMPDNIHLSVLTSHSPSLPLVSKNLTVASVAFTPQSETHTRVDLGACLMKYFNYKGRWTGPWGGCSQWGLPWTPAEGGWYLIPKLPPRRLRPSAWLQSWMQRLSAQLPSGRWKLSVQIIPIPCNGPLMRACKTWNTWISKRKGGIAKPFWRHVGWL